MILAIDVHYRTDEAQAVGVLFDWNSIHPIQIIKSTIKGVEEYLQKFANISGFKVHCTKHKDKNDVYYREKWTVVTKKHVVQKILSGHVLFR